MKVIVLAGGFSTRLYPLTKNFPKALLPIGRKTIVDFVVEEILAIKEIDEVILVTNNCFYSLFKSCAIIKGKKLTSFVEKPAKPSSLYMGVPYYIFPKESLPLVNEYAKIGKNLDSPGSILSWLIGKSPTFVYKVENGYYFDVGTNEVYKTVRKKILA